MTCWTIKGGGGGGYEPVSLSTSQTEILMDETSNKAENLKMSYTFCIASAPEIKHPAWQLEVSPSCTSIAHFIHFSQHKHTKHSHSDFTEITILPSFFFFFYRILMCREKLTSDGLSGWMAFLSSHFCKRTSCSVSANPYWRLYLPHL